MNDEEIEIKIIAAADRGAVKKLYQEAGWWSAEDEDSGSVEWIGTMVGGSFCFVGAFRGSEMIGMGRAISDGVSDAYIQDVTVLKSFRGRGIGARIVHALGEFLRSRGIGWIGLVAEPGTKEFYQPLGFEVMEGYSFMRWKLKKN